MTQEQEVETWSKQGQGHLGDYQGECVIIIAP